MNVIMLAPGFPAEMPLFTRGLAAVGARVIGVGDQPEAALHPQTRAALAAYIQVPSFGDEGAVVERLQEIARRVRVDRVECLWEPLMILAARARETLGLPGMTVDETIPFRDKEIMKRVLDEASIRTPRHASSTTKQGCREAADRIGFPLIVKPISGAGSADTYRVDAAEELESVLARVGHVSEVSVEEFIDGEDFTFDTVCIDGEIQHYNIGFYRPRALIARENEWVSPQTFSIRDVDDPGVQSGLDMGQAVIQALGFKTGFTHMEWYRKSNGEAVFGEIAARAPGAHTVDLINYASDIDMFRGWAEAVCHGSFTERVERKHNAVSIFKRAQGQGRIQRIEGLGRLTAELGSAICVIDLLPLGAPRRNWLQTLVSDGLVILRHPDLDTLIEMADRVAVELQLYAG